MRKIFSSAVALISISLLSASQLSAAATPSPTNRYVAFLAQETGGFTTYEWAFQRTPSVVVYSDGLTISEVPYRPAIYPGQIVSSYLQKIELGAVNRVLTAAAKVKLNDTKFDWGSTMIVDVTDTNVLTQQSPRAPRVRVSIYALSFFDTAIDPAKRAARKAARTFIDKVENFDSSLYWTKSKALAWKPSRWVYVSSLGDKDEFSVVRPWFGAKALTSGFKCQEMSPLENSRFNSLLPKINQASRFSSNGQTWRVTFRPLFPHESSCSDILR